MGLPPVVNTVRLDLCLSRTQHNKFVPSSHIVILALGCMKVNFTDCDNCLIPGPNGRCFPNGRYCPSGVIIPGLTS